MLRPKAITQLRWELEDEDVEPESAPRRIGTPKNNPHWPAVLHQDRAILDRIRAGDRFGHEINGSKAGDAALALHREHNIAAIHIIDRRIQSLRRAGKVMFSRKARRPEPKERNVTATDHTRDHEYLAMGRALERACRSLPEGWSIVKPLNTTQRPSI